MTSISPQRDIELKEAATGAALELPESGESDKLVLARCNLFAVTSRRGDIVPAGARDLGLFYLDMRHLSHLELQLSGQPPIVLSAETWETAFSQIDLTLTDRQVGDLVEDPQNSVHLRRKQLLDDELVEQVVVTNHLRRPIEISLEMHFGADFADIFEVRGARRQGRGQLIPPLVRDGQIELGYRGVSGEVYRTVIRFLPQPTEISGRAARWRVALEAGEASILEVVVTPLRNDAPLPERRPFDQRLARVRTDQAHFVAEVAHYASDDKVLEGALDRGLSDVAALRVEQDRLAIVSAGIPWYAAPFGRDSILTALEMLSVTPGLAYETLELLGVYQGRHDDPSRDEEPGKIMHELRRGEMARSSEIPHSPYYGSVDATPLYCILLGEAFRWTADEALLERIFPYAERALGWVERTLAAGGGFLRYQRRTPRGLENQCWKDSTDGISFPDGERAKTPLAVVEVQGYAVAALDEMATLYLRRGEPVRAAALREQARSLRQRIEERYWVEETRYYALALDGRDRPVPTLTSDPGHLLWSRAITPERAQRVAQVLLGEAMFSGWGIRTLGRGQAVYNPISYHNGSVWPHDNALCALGMARYHLRAEPEAVLTALHAASQHFRYFRLPELFCGMSRSAGEFLVEYPVSCSPQAWASASLFMMLQAVLGLDADAPAGRLHILNPRLPGFVRRLELRNLRLGGARISLRFLREGARCHVDLIDVVGAPVRVQIELE
jgi:glycogen debranching enzyme